MGSHPANLALRFLLEMTALAAMGFWGWQLGEGLVRYVFASVTIIAASALWGVFAVPGDPSRSGSAPVAVSGMIRLAIEATFFAFGTWAVYQWGGRTLGIVFAVALVGHYAISYDRIAWLLRA
jgi:Protein of unknown function (DUF2568)